MAGYCTKRYLGFCQVSTVEFFCIYGGVFLKSNWQHIVQKRSPEVFYEKSCSWKFHKIRRKHLCQSLFFNTSLQLYKKETLVQVFSCEFCEIFKNIFLQNTSGRLLLIVVFGSSKYAFAINIRDYSFSRYAIFSEKINIFCPQIRTPTCAYQGVRNVSFSDNFAYLLNEWFHTLDLWTYSAH